MMKKPLVKFSPFFLILQVFYYFTQLEEVMFENRLNRGQKDYTYLHDNRLISLNNRLTQLVNQVKFQNIYM